MLLNNCPQLYMYFLITIISYVLLYHNIRGGFDIFLEYQKYNWYIDLGFIIIISVIIQLLCNSRFKILTWIILFLTVILNIYGIINKKQVIKTAKSLVAIEKNTNKNYFEATEEMIKRKIMKEKKYKRK